jgi:hypothetical protein
VPKAQGHGANEDKFSWCREAEQFFAFRADGSKGKDEEETGGLTNHPTRLDSCEIPISTILLPDFSRPTGRPLCCQSGAHHNASLTARLTVAL